MSTIHPGAGKSALLIVDVQTGVVAAAWERDRVVGNIALAVAQARGAGVPVIWVLHEDEELPRDSESWRLVPELSTETNEPVIHKRYNSAFEDTALEALLAEREVRHVVLAGAATNWCIRATAYAALDRGYNLTLVADGHTTGDMEMGEGRVIAARDLVDDLNIAMTWLAYPGRSTAATTAADLSFGGPGLSASS